MKLKDLDNFIIYITLGTVLGGRIGEFIFYNIKELFYFEIFKIWNGGMSFHGALIGLILAVYLFCKKKNYNFRGWTKSYRPRY